MKLGLHHSPAISNGFHCLCKIHIPPGGICDLVLTHIFDPIKSYSLSTLHIPGLLSISPQMLNSFAHLHPSTQKLHPLSSSYSKATLPPGSLWLVSCFSDRPARELDLTAHSTWHGPLLCLTLNVCQLGAKKKFTCTELMISLKILGKERKQLYPNLKISHQFNE